jgi:hypothetical protein
VLGFAALARGQDLVSFEKRVTALEKAWKDASAACYSPSTLTRTRLRRWPSNSA